MKRFTSLILVVLIVTALYIPASANASSEKDLFLYDRIAYLSIPTQKGVSGANYFMLRPIIGKANNAGNLVGTMFDGVVLAPDTTPRTPVEAEQFISTLLEDNGQNVPAVNSVVADLKDGKFIAEDYKYPVFIGLPYFYAAFPTDEQRLEFCEYFIITLLSVFETKELNNVYIAGISFGIEYDAVPDFRNDCIDIVRRNENNLLSISLTTIGGNIKSDIRISAKSNIDFRLSMAEELEGTTMNLNGVPSVEDRSFLNELKADFEKFKASSAREKCIVFTFTAANDVYQCAAALEETIPNENGRATYDLIADMLEYNGSTPDESLVSEESTDDFDNALDNGTNWFENLGPWQYLIYTTIALLLVGLVVVLLFFVRKGKQND